MLELRPICEHCAKPLPPAARDAMVCTFECTFCADCAKELFEDVCPNCGGGFQPRPVRPCRPHRPPWYLGEHPAGTNPKHRPKDLIKLRELQDQLKTVDPHDR